MIYKCFGFVLFFMTLSLNVMSQDVEGDSEIDYLEETEYEDSRVYLFAFDLNAIQPLGQFYPEKDIFLVGVTFSFMTQLIKEKGLMIGLDVSFNSLEEAKGSFIEFDGALERDLDFTTNTNLTLMLVNTRYYLDVNLGKFNPYVEALLGGKIMSTNSDFIDVNDDTFSDSKWHKFSFSSSFGFGLGGQYQVGDNVYIDTKMRYLSGTADTYYTLKKERLSTDIDIENFKLSLSKTDVAFYSVGIVLKF